MFPIRSTLAPAVLLALGATASCAANAQAGITADLGTTGAGAHVVVPLGTTLNARLGANYMSRDFEKNTTNVDYKLKGKLQTVDALLDWYVLDGSSFHLTGGVVYNGNKFDATGNPSRLGTFKLNGKTYAVSDVGILTGKLDYRKAAPYLGIGWGNTLGTGSKWNVSADIGAFYQGHVKVELASVGCGAAAAACARLANDVAAEALRLREDTDKLKFYPVLRLSIGYRF
jgi:hypothetical protein